MSGLFSSNEERKKGRKEERRGRKRERDRTNLDDASNPFRIASDSLDIAAADFDDVAASFEGLEKGFVVGLMLGRGGEGGRKEWSGIRFASLSWIGRGAAVVRRGWS